MLESKSIIKRDIETKEPSIDKFLDNLDLLSRLLKEEEMFCFVLINFGGAWTTKDIRDMFIVYRAKQGHIKIPKKIWDFYVVGEQKTPKLMGLMHNTVQYVSTPIFVKELEKLLKSKNYSIPSYKTFDKYLDNLKNLGLIIKRPDPTLVEKKRKVELWVMNPNLINKIKERYNKNVLDEYLNPILNKINKILNETFIIEK